MGASYSTWVNNPSGSFAGRIRNTAGPAVLSHPLGCLDTAGPAVFGAGPEGPTTPPNGSPVHNPDQNTAGPAVLCWGPERKDLTYGGRIINPYSVRLEGQISASSREAAQFGRQEGSSRGRIKSPNQEHASRARIKRGRQEGASTQLASARRAEAN